MTQWTQFKPLFQECRGVQSSQMSMSLNHLRFLSNKRHSKQMNRSFRHFCKHRMTSSQRIFIVDLDWKLLLILNLDLTNFEYIQIKTIKLQNFKMALFNFSVRKRNIKIVPKIMGTKSSIIYLCNMSCVISFIKRYIFFVKIREIKRETSFVAV